MAGLDSRVCMAGFVLTALSDVTGHTVRSQNRVISFNLSFRIIRDNHGARLAGHAGDER